MKKNKMMRIASVLLIVTLLSTCALSGTFAKYVTTAEGAGDARVAKWGVELSIENADPFKTQYDKDDASYTNTAYSVKSMSSTECVAAPGTSNLDAPFVAHITGDSEVATRFSLGIDVTEIVLPAGTYRDYTKPEVDGEYEEFTLTEDYYPVVLTLSVDFGGHSYEISGNWAAIEAGLLAIAGTTTLSRDVRPGQALDGEFTLTWEWPYERADLGADVAELIDKCDTYLGIQAQEDPQYMSFDFLASAVQID